MALASCTCSSLQSPLFASDLASHQACVYIAPTQHNHRGSNPNSLTLPPLSQHDQETVRLELLVRGRGCHTLLGDAGGATSGSFGNSRLAKGVLFDSCTCLACVERLLVLHCPTSWDRNHTGLAISTCSYTARHSSSLHQQIISALLQDWYRNRRTQRQLVSARARTRSVRNSTNLIR